MTSLLKPASILPPLNATVPIEAFAPGPPAGLVNAAGLVLYRLWWNLADIACLIDEFRRPHRPTEDSTASWTYLNGCLAD